MICNLCGIRIQPLFNRIGPTIAESNDALGHTVCTICGQVLEENTIVSQIEFNESSGVQGLSISNSAARQKSSGKFSSQVASVTHLFSLCNDALGTRLPSSE